MKICTICFLIDTVQNVTDCVGIYTYMPTSMARGNELAIKKKPAAIGSIGLKLNGSTDMTDRDDECELGYWIGKPFWGQGMIPEASRALLCHAFEDLGMRAVWCGYYEGNEKSKRVQKKLGFIYQYTTEGLEVTLVNEIRTGHTNMMTKEHWQEVYYGAETD